jgi:NADPH:quinone reductase
MDGMRALVADPDGLGGVAVQEVAEPEAARGEAIVDVRAISLNRGELHRLRAAAAGWRPGWDIAGIVKTAAAGSPPVGARVVGLLTGGGWAERVAIRGDWLAELPTEVSFAQAAALPVAGLTALRTLRLGPAILGRRVLVAGAAGGVGRFAIQLARLGGAEVTAIAGSPERAKGLRELGALEVVSDTDELHGRFDLVLESAGGDSLARLVTMVHPDGTLVMFGNSSRQPTTFNVSDVYLDGAVRLQGFELFHGVAADPPDRDLRYLADLVAEGRLNPHVAGELPWTEMPEALRRLADRAVPGKLVLTL